MPRSKSWSGRASRRRSDIRTSPRAASIAPASGPVSSEILARLEAAALVAGIWLVPGEHDLPVFRCQVIETEGHREIAPMPGEGFACDFTHDARSCEGADGGGQARVTAIAGAREDITRRAYPERYDRERLAAWRRQLASPPRTQPASRRRDEPPPGPLRSRRPRWRSKSRRAGGARRAALQPARPALEVVRLVAPPLASGSGQ